MSPNDLLSFAVACNCVKSLPAYVSLTVCTSLADPENPLTPPANPLATAAAAIVPVPDPAHG